jgi:hypothetical protein
MLDAVADTDLVAVMPYHFNRPIFNTKIDYDFSGPNVPNATSFKLASRDGRL